MNTTEAFEPYEAPDFTALELGPTPGCAMTRGGGHPGAAPTAWLSAAHPGAAYTRPLLAAHPGAVMTRGPGVR